MHLTFKEILQLIDKVADRGIAAVEVEQAGVRVRIEGKSNTPQVIPAYISDVKPNALPAAPIAAIAAAAPPPQPAEADSEAGLHVITSPIVGTFYRAPNPESEAFVNVGDHITKGKVLCIVEAMKLMNEIESDLDGVVVRVYPQNGQPVEYGEKLFAVKP
jgi:acetyl-CoA carboxylase biotin carboxyl carrier protein